MVRSDYLNKRDSIGQLWDRATILYYKRDLKKAEAIYAQVGSEHVNRYYCWTQLGRGQEVLELLGEKVEISDPYERSFLFAGSSEIDSALYYFELLDDWQDVAGSRFDPDFAPIWNEARYKAKVAEYNFPPLVDQ